MSDKRVDDGGPAFPVEVSADAEAPRDERGETMQLMMLPHRIWSLVLKYNAKRRGDICELAIRGGPYGVSIRYAYHGPRGFVSEYLHNESLQRFLAIRSLIRGELVEVVRHRRTSDRWKEWRLSDARYDTVLENRSSTDCWFIAATKMGCDSMPWSVSVQAHRHHSGENHADRVPDRHQGIHQDGLARNSWGVVDLSAHDCIGDRGIRSMGGCPAKA